MKADRSCKAYGVMTDSPSPHEKLLLLLEKIGIEPIEMDRLRPFRKLLISRKNNFADYFYNFFLGISDTRTILEGEKEPGLMKRVWSHWFEMFFHSEANNTFLTYLWKVGVRHVEVNLDQRFSNLGFAMIRQFCHKVIVTDIPLEQRSQVLSTIDKMVDLCVLVETAAYIENTISCDIEVMREVADRVRNPAMIIGWNIKKLQGKVGEGTKEYNTYQMLMSENQRLENMVKDIKVYMEMFQGEPIFQSVDLNELVGSVLEKIDSRNKYGHVRVTINCREQACHLKGDPKWLEHLFYYLIENSMEAAGTHDPVMKISSEFEVVPPFNIRIEIFNSGSPPEEEIEKLFSPFFSTKPTGTGFGLPIARLVARKHHGTLSIAPAEGQEGTCVTIGLPGSGQS
jgi:signal transduction histidine kinase